jgi:hypothetical protein
MKPGYLKNCIINLKDEDQDKTIFHADGDIINTYLDGYAIIPVSEYEKLKKESKQ